jgi:hypothetical protein
MRSALATVALLLSLAPIARAQSLYPIAQLGPSYTLSVDTTPAPAAFVGWCPTCAGHMLIGAAHDGLVLSRRAGGSVELGAAWTYAPGTTGTLASGGAVVATGGVSIGNATKAALQQVPGTAEALGYSDSRLSALGYAVRFDAFGGPRVGGANGIPRYVYGGGITLNLTYSYSSLAAIFGK